MSDNNVRRPRRIIEGELPPTPVPDIAAALQSHRFQRALVSAGAGLFDEAKTERRDLNPASASTGDADPGAPRETAPDPSASPVAPKAARKGASTGARKGAQKGAAKGAAKGTQKDGSKVAPKDAPAARAGVAPPAAATGAPATGFAAPPTSMFDFANIADPAGKEGRSGPKTAGKADDWDEDLCRRIGLLCRKISADIPEWEVTVPLHPVKLPESQLNIRLSSHRMGLRFFTQSAYTQRILSEHQSRLVQMLEKALPYSREIDIDVS